MENNKIIKYTTASLYVLLYMKMVNFTIFAM